MLYELIADLPNIFLNSYEKIVSEFYNAIIHIIVFLLFYILMCFYIYKSVKKIKKNNEIFQNVKRALFVIAHPDDECMFFGPTILNLNKQGIDIYLLCLSTGNYDQKGIIRSLELYEACTELKIKKNRITICIDTLMPDDPGVRWPTNHVANIILHQIETLSIDILVTFDRSGVSSHANHSSIFYAVAGLCVEKRFPTYCKIFTLDSVNRLRKYWSYLDLPLSFLLSSYRFILSTEDKQIVTSAMKKYKSQMVWFRYLYLFFTRYVVINTLRHITLTDIELELEVDE